MKHLIKKLLREQLLSEAISLSDLIQKTNSNLDEYMLSVTEWVPVEFLDTIKHVDRKIAPFNDEETMDELKASIMEEGFKDALIIEYDPNDDTVLLTEGNHRLLIAKELGIPALPCLVFLRRSKREGYDHRAKKVRGIENKDQYRDRFEPEIIRVDRYQKPSFVGIPVIN